MSDHTLAILWDMDGTIIDTKACHFSTWQTTLKKFGFELDEAVFDANFGRNTRSILPIFIGHAIDAELTEKIIHEKAARFREVAPKEVSLVPGVESWLAAAKNGHLTQAIASSASMENIRSMMSNFNLLKYFDIFVSGAELPAKPKPDVFLQAARVIEKLPENCVVIEDSVAGVKAALKARMKCIAVATTHSKSELMLANFVVQDFSYPLMDALNNLGIDLTVSSE